MTKNLFHNYLINLGFYEDEILINEDVFSYSPSPQIPSIKYVLIKSNDEIFQYHLKLWNQNSDNVFLAVDSTKTYLINAKAKPDPDSPLKRGICIRSFNYGVNSKGYEDIDIETISKHSISSTYFYQFIQEKQGKNKHEVDKDLLINLLTLRNDLIDGDNEHVIHLLILRCLFVKYLEDREIFDKNLLPGVLGSNDPRKLIDAFDEVRKINGDVFGNTLLSEKDIKPEYLEKLFLFFTTDYQSGQGTLFPYRFDCIPIQLISHVYEAFLKNETKKDKGIYYTPSFVVGFMLSQSLRQKAEVNPSLTVLDPAVGSGAFLVQSFKILRDAFKCKLSLKDKKQILENQLWGIDIDEDALQITAFSLYLALLEDELPETIKREIENSNPILPSLIGKTLRKANSLIDPVFEDQKFDYIVSNPPWGSVPSERTPENIAERDAIDNKNGDYPEYKYVADYERSQAFLMRVSRWQKEDTITAMIVKNSIFLNDTAINFRKDFLKLNRIETFFELSHYNKILFKKKIIGRIRGKQPVEIGATEPCAIVVFRSNFNKVDYLINYISPKLTRLGEHFELIHYTSNETFEIEQQEFIENDALWRILVDGDNDSISLINRIRNKKDKNFVIESGRGFEPKKDGKSFGLPIWKNWLDIDCFERYFIKKLKQYNWNQEFRNKRDFIFDTSSIAIARRPLKNDGKRLKAVAIPSGVVYKDNIVFAKIKQGTTYISDYKYLESLFNSSLIGFFLTITSSQWEKGDQKWAALRTGDIEKLPIHNLIAKKEKISEILEIRLKSDFNKLDEHQLQIDEIIFDIFELTDYEKEIILEFYQVNVNRADKKLQTVNYFDLEEYFVVFKEAFVSLLSPAFTINASCNISVNIGAIIKISIVEKANEAGIQSDNSMQVLQFVKNKQITETDKLFKEEKVKIYEPPYDFYIIKSNQFKDWTKRQAIKDAKEEIGLFLSKLPETNE